MHHDKTVGTESAPAGAGTDSVSTVPRECGIIRDVSVMAAADAPHSIGANCPTCRLSSARPMFNGRADAGIRDGCPPQARLHIDPAEAVAMFGQERTGHGEKDK